MFFAPDRVATAVTLFRTTSKDRGMPRKYFGTDGIRGTVGQPPITPDFVLRLAHAVAMCSSAMKRGPRC